MIDFTQTFYKVFGRSDGAMYMQDGRYFRKDGSPVGQDIPVEPAIPIEPEPVAEPDPVTPEPEPNPVPFDPKAFYVTPPANVVAQHEVNYSRKHLREIADKEGISGLRKIAKPFGLKGRGKSELIKEILEAQVKAKEVRAKFEEENELIGDQGDQS